MNATPRVHLQKRRGLALPVPPPVSRSIELNSALRHPASTATKMRVSPNNQLAARKILANNERLCARAAPSRPAHPGLLATCCAAPVGPEMRVARVKNSPEPAEHGLHLGAALAAATRRRPAFALTFTFCPSTPRKAGSKKQKQSEKNTKRGAASNRRHSYGRVEPGTRTAPILGHRVVRVRWYPARSLKPAAGIAAVTSLPATSRADSTAMCAITNGEEPARTRRGL